MERIPDRIGPCTLEPLGKLVRVSAPAEFSGLLFQAGGSFDKGLRCWWVPQHRLGPLLRKLEAASDTLFRAAGVSL